MISFPAVLVLPPAGEPTILQTRVAAAAGVSPDDMLITLYEVPGENISFGQGEAQRANAVARAQDSPRQNSA